MQHMNDRERFHGVMNYEPVDRGVYGVWTDMWPETVERWKQEGYRPEHGPLFATDHWAWQGGWFFPNPPFAHRVIADEGETIVYVNHEGIVIREFKNNPMSSMPQFVRFPVETREDFRRFCRDRMQPDLAGRIGTDYVSQLALFRERDHPLIVIADRWGGFFGPLRNLVGVQRLCLLFYDDPGLVEEMMDATADFIIAVMDRILDQTDVDVFGFWEDMAYKTAPLISPKLVRKYMLPRYRRVVDFLRRRGVKWIALDSDGQITTLIPVWLEAGINFIYPFEVQAGMDVLAVRRQFGKDLRMLGGVDKRPLMVGRKAIDAELARIAPLVQEGGYIPSLDHTIPPDVSFENYLYYMEQLRTIM
jgi:hypothetical protein